MIRSFEKFILDLFGPGRNTDIEKSLINTHILKQKEYFEDNDCPEFPLIKILEFEKHLLGIHLSGNPFTIIGQVARYSYVSAKSLMDAEGSVSGGILCQIRSVKKITSKNGNLMAFIDGVDHTQTPFSVALFNNVEKYADCLVANKYVIINAVCKDGNKGRSLMALGISDLTKDVEGAAFVKTSKDIKTLNIYFNGSPGTVQIKSLYNKLSTYLSDVDTGFYLNVNVDIDGVIFFIKKFNFVEITIDVVRELNKISNIYITRGINGANKRA
jgi:DNA polymerase III alpha subunit